jgi:enoyl-CoA hydratase/carnithine racemase
MGDSMIGNESIVVFTHDGDVGHVEMNRPPHNLLEGTLLDGLERAFSRAVDEGCRAILLSSRLRHFCAGADLESMVSGELGRLDLIGFLRSVEDLPIPTVAAIHGAALGGGFELALACDLIIAAESAQIGLVETTLGLLPIMGGVPRAVANAGLARAKELILLGRRHTAATLEQWGLVNQVVPDEALAEASLSIARQLAAGPTVAFRAVKRIANHTVSHGVWAGDELTAEAAAPVWESSDLKAGLDAFFATGTAEAVFSGS